MQMDSAGMGATAKWSLGDHIQRPRPKVQGARLAPAPPTDGSRREAGAGGQHVGAIAPGGGGGWGGGGESGLSKAWTKNVACPISKQRLLRPSSHSATAASPVVHPEGTQDGEKQDTGPR